MSGGALEASVTLEEVYAVVASKRVPLAPELAGYLALEIAERADPDGGDVDPKSVFVSEEGTVALVKPKREAGLGGAESSIRAALARLIEASGSQTPALAAASKRRSGVGLPALAEELEAALIPVNRAAGRRALARLAREVKRVTLGLGRHTLPSSPDSFVRTGARAGGSPTADAPPSSRRGAPPASSPAADSPPASVPAEPAQRRPRVPRFSPEEDPTTTRKQIPDQLLAREPFADRSDYPTTQFKSSSRGPSPSQAEVDDLIADFAVSGGGEQQHARELRALAGLDATPAPPRLRQAAPPAPNPVPEPDETSASEAGLDALLAARSDAREDASSPSRPAAAASLSPSRSSAVAPSRAVDSRQLPTQPSQLRHSPTAPPKVRRAPSRRGSWVSVVVAILAVGAGTLAVRWLQPAAFAVHGANETRPTYGANGAAPPLPSDHASASCIGTLVVTDVPPHAEVLLRAGQAPVDVERMPVGARLEFVATAEGYAPKRVVIPQAATWDVGTDGKPRFETAVQLDPSRARPGTNDAWPAGEPGSAVGGQGPAGTVHVVASPRGAEVWMLAGLGPEARVEALSCEHDIDVLVAGPATTRSRLHVGRDDFVDSSDAAIGSVTRIARVSAK